MKRRSEPARAVCKLLSVSGLLALLAAGCGGGASPAQLNRSYRVLEQAETAYKAKDHGKAKELFSVAIKAGSVRADLLGECHIKRAVCQIELNELDAADADLQKAEESGAVGADYLKANGQLYLKRGDRVRARDFYQKAKVGDSSVEIPPELIEKKKPGNA